MICYCYNSLLQFDLAAVLKPVTDTVVMHCSAQPTDCPATADGEVGIRVRCSVPTRPSHIH